MISNQFSPPTTHWFTSAFESATPIQQAAWATISQGKHTLIVAPTGSGKTLAAFLWALDNLVSSPTPVDKPACRILYVSPLKALAVDVERNLRAPLIGLTNACHQLNLPLPSISIATRTADTSQAERRAFARKPTDILITTPESLFLLLTSSASSALTAITTVIIDEVHALCSNKRGSHLALSLERLDLLCAKPAQRIGLSATVEPLTEAAEFLGGVAPVTIVNPPSRKKFDITVSACSADRNPVVDIPTGNASANPGAGSLWEPVIHELHQVIGRHHSTIVFTNSRRLCERLSGGLNELSNLQTHNPPPAQAPAQFMGASGQGGSSPAVIARTHHGSMSKQQRALVEESLKAGEIPAVVATSSLELGIDMGAVDLVAHISAPPSVAAGLQRLGRAGHHVNAVSRGIIFPIHQADIISCTVIAERMHAGQLESLRYRRNPLDVLAQHIVSMVAMDQWQVDELATVIRRAAPFTALPDSSLYAVLDMLSGRYVSDDFAQLRPQIIWNRITNMLSARPGAARLAITSGGTIPDRGLFGVFIVGADKNRATRVGELDEEMVYESRVGDVIVLGSSSWKIQEITHDRVLVSPAPGQPGRMPYWHGDFLGRPFELGQAIGAFTRQITQDPVRVKQPTAAITLTPHTQDSILDYIRQQQQATIAVPDDQTIVVERFRDELGDWRIVVHSIFGGCINAPWGLAIAARLRDQYGIDGQIMSADDGIVIRFPDLSGESAPPDSDLVVFDPLEISGIVTQQISGSALFASRFRECAARSLLLPKRNPAQRAALWQQRQRAASLLQIASKHHNFPVVLEALRECLHDVYDLENLQKIMQNIADRTITIADVTTISPSPFSRSLLFSYVGTFLYDGDSPLAERKAQALALDSVVLTELLGRTELHDLLDPQVIDEITQQLQWLSPQRQARNLEQVADLLQIVGPLTTDEAIRRGAQEDWLNELEKTRRIIRIRHGGQWYWIITEDAGRVRDALGVVLPPGLAASVCESVPDPLADVVSRYARTHGPFSSSDCAHALGLPVAVVTMTLRRLVSQSAITEGTFSADVTGSQWCDAGVLRQIRRRTLAKLRSEVEPVSTTALARFLPVWHKVGPLARSGMPALVAAIEQIQAVPIAASALEQLVLPARVSDYQPWMLDELCTSGEVIWVGSGSLTGNDGLVRLVFSDSMELLTETAEAPAVIDPIEHQILKVLAPGQALFFRSLSDQMNQLNRVDLASQTSPIKETDLIAALWSLIWQGHIVGDSFAPIRALLSSGRSASSRGRSGATARPRLRYRSYSLSASRLAPQSRIPASVGGRWSRLVVPETTPGFAGALQVQALLDRQGIVAHSTIAAEHIPGGFAGLYPTLSTLEEQGQLRRGYFVETLGGAQFSLPEVIDQLRSCQEIPSHPETVLVLAATDPANVYGASVPWPERGTDALARPGRKAGAIVVLVDGKLVLYVERGGRTMMNWGGDERDIHAACAALTSTISAGRVGAIRVEKVNGVPVWDTPVGKALTTAGFTITPQGLQYRPSSGQ